MSRTTLRIVIVLAALSIVGITLTQIYWVRKAFDLRENQFNRDVNTALLSVASKIFEINKTPSPANNPVTQLSTNYFVVLINGPIDGSLLEFLLTTEFERHNIKADFEYGIYDCIERCMVGGNYISPKKNIKANMPAFPQWKDDGYYFGVQFPAIEANLISQMGIWGFSSAVLLIVIFFFVYTLFVILKQRRLSEVQKDFINNMTHEFKTPISTIAISTEVLKDPGIIHTPERLLNYATTEFIGLQATNSTILADLTNAYTPSFGLMGHESLIMQQSDIGAIADSVKDCLRCGKCKPVCSTHVPRANLLYSPRNKILATSLLIEAFLYEEQTRRGISLKHWEEFEDVADHCTVCHKCLAPCPVAIDFGEVSMNMRNLLRKMGHKSFRPGNAAAMLFLNATNPQTIKLMRGAMVDVGFKVQRFANQMLRLAARRQTAAPPATVGRAPVKEQVIHFINKKMPGGLPKKTARALLDIEDANYVPIIRNPVATTADTEAVFYFPGCGSERLFSQVGLATQAMLWHAGVQTVLPPGYLCCGYPQRGSGQFDKADKIITDNRVLFHRVANTLNYLDIKTVVVSCGTCYDQLQGYRFEDIFPGCRIIDIHEYLLEKGIVLTPSSGSGSVGYLYHDPCHSPMKLQDPMKTVKALVGNNVLKNERCCGESGTLGVTRPDIATQVRFRKEEELRLGEAALRAAVPMPEGANVKILTSCPSCLQGLKRYEGDLQNGLLEADYIVVEMARKILGEDWLPQYVARANAGGIERVLV